MKPNVGSIAGQGGGLMIAGLGISELVKIEGVTPDIMALCVTFIIALGVSAFVARNLRKAERGSANARTEEPKGETQ